MHCWSETAWVDARMPFTHSSRSCPDHRRIEFFPIDDIEIGPVSKQSRRGDWYFEHWGR